MSLYFYFVYEILCVLYTIVYVWTVYVTALLPFGVINDDMSISIK